MTTLTVTTWNVLANAYLRPDYYPHLDRFDDEAVRTAACAAVIGDLAATSEVLALQEIEAPLVAAVHDLLGERFSARWTRRGGGRSDGTLLAVRRDVPHVIRGGRGELGDHAWCAATIEADSGRVHVAATHLTWSDQPAATHPGLAQLRALEGHLGADAVLVGDLNDTGGGPVTSHLEGTGWHPNPVCGPTAVVNGREPVAIDWAYTRGSVTVVDAHLGHHTADPLPNRTFPSDHVPLTVTVEVAGPPT